MDIKHVIFLYLGILLPIIFLYLFTALAPAFISAPVPDLHNATPVFAELIKVIVSAAIGAFSVFLGKK